MLVHINILVYVVHPGLVKTNLFRNDKESEKIIYSLGKFSKNCITGALTPLMLVLKDCPVLPYAY